MGKKATFFVWRNSQDEFRKVDSFRKSSLNPHWVVITPLTPSWIVRLWDTINTDNLSRKFFSEIIYNSSPLINFFLGRIVRRSNCKPRWIFRRRANCLSEELSRKKMSAKNFPAKNESVKSIEFTKNGGNTWTWIVGFIEFQSQAGYVPEIN